MMADNGDDGYSGKGFTPRPGDEFHLPVRWHQWPVEEQINFLTLAKKRADMLALLRGYIGSERTSDRLDKNELAHILIEMEVVR